MTKVCSKCKENKALEDYYKDNRVKDGKRSECKSCSITESKKYNAEHKQERLEHSKKYYVEHKQECLEYEQKRIKKYRKAWISILKEIYGKIACVKCGYSKCFAALDFHHRKPETKKFNISYILKSKVTAEGIKEIKKCDLLCANCHREFHNGSLVDD